uniref:Uncharacterized protein n=1 Tax=Ditylenchus dipsaci TaxID=166011 RepID=A0A915DUB0_9BILA
MSLRRNSDGSEEELLWPSSSGEGLFHYNQPSSSPTRRKEGVGGGTAWTTTFYAPLAAAFSCASRGVRTMTSSLSSIDHQMTDIPLGLKDKKVSKAVMEEKESSVGGKMNGLHWITSASFIVADIAGGE